MYQQIFLQGWKIELSHVRNMTAEAKPIVFFSIAGRKYVHLYLVKNIKITIAITFQLIVASRLRRKAGMVAIAALSWPLHAVLGGQMIRQVCFFLLLELSATGYVLSLVCLLFPVMRVYVWSMPAQHLQQESGFPDGDLLSFLLMCKRRHFL